MLAIGNSFLYVLPALFLMIGVGIIADRLERIVFDIRRKATATPEQRQRMLAIEQRSRDQMARVNKMKETAVAAKTEIEKHKEEMSRLRAVETRFTESNRRIVGEIGQPERGSPAFFAILEGPANSLPFSSIASLPTKIATRRRFRVVIWGMGPLQAERLAQELGGPDSQLIRIRPFNGKLRMGEAT